MLHFQSGPLDPGNFWHVAASSFGSKTGTDLFMGRNVYGILAALNLNETKVDTLSLDTVRVPRETFAAILEAWRDDYAEPIGEHTPFSREAAVAHFNQMIGHIRDPLRYAVWMVPVVSARVPSEFST